MSEPTPNFDEPDLKRAIRGVVGTHRASAALRDRVAQAMASAVVPDVPKSASAAETSDERPPMRIGPSPLKRYLTLAAAVVIGFAVCYQSIEYYGSWRRTPGRQASNSTSYDIAPDLLEGMLALQTRGATLNTTPGAPARDVRPLQASTADAAALAREASDALLRHVPTPTLTGWTIDRAAVTEISGYQAARFHFTKGAQSVTLVSLPAGAWRYRNSDHYCTRVQDGQAIAGYIAGDSLNCLVGDASMSAADVDGLLTSLRNQ